MGDRLPHRPGAPPRRAARSPEHTTAATRTIDAGPRPRPARTPPTTPAATASTRPHPHQRTARTPRTPAQRPPTEPRRPISRQLHQHHARNGGSRLRPRAGPHQLLATREPPTQNPAALIRHPHRLKLTAPQQARQRTRVQLVGLGPRARDPSVIRRDDHDPVHMRLKDPRDLPTATRHLQRHPIRRQQTLRQRPDPVRRARHPTRRPHHPVLTDRDHTELAMHVQADRTTHPSRQSHDPTSNSVDSQRENQRDNDTDRYELNRSIQASRRRGRTKTTGSKPIDQNGLPVYVLPIKPLSRINRT